MVDVISVFTGRHHSLLSCCADTLP